MFGTESPRGVAGGCTDVRAICDARQDAEQANARQAAWPRPAFLLPVLALVAALCAFAPPALADGEGWSLNIHNYDIAGGLSDVNAAQGYISEDGDICYCYDWTVKGPGADGRDYDHMESGTHATDYVLAKGYPNVTAIEGYELSAAEAQAATQLAAWLASGTLTVAKMQERYAAAPADVLAAAQALAAAAQGYAGGDAAIDGASCVLTVSGDAGVQAMLAGNAFGHISLVKASASPDMTAGNPLYVLEGFEYGVYLDAECTREYVPGLALGDDDAANRALDFRPGTYYVKETAAPASGSYLVDATVYEVQVRSGAVAQVNGGQVRDVPLSFAAGELSLLKRDGASADGAAQGDATLAGAEFELACFGNVEGDVTGEPLRTWVLVGDADGLVRFDAAHLKEGSPAFFEGPGGQEALPLGTYRLREVKPPAGYLVNDTVHVMVLSADDAEQGGVAVTHVPGFSSDSDGVLVAADSVVRGGVRVVKADAELRASEALAGDGSRGATGAPTLSGVEFTIANASEAAVLVAGRWFAPGEPVMTIASAYDEAAGAYIAQTPADALPYGTYSVAETKANGTYLLSDGAPRLFEVRADGELTRVSSDGADLAFFDRVVRNDLELEKRVAGSGAGLQVAFALTNLATGECHVIVTDADGRASTEAGRKAGAVNGNDGLIGEELVTADMMDAAQGVWFSLGEDGSRAPFDAGLAALPFGDYELAELRCETNVGRDLVVERFRVEADFTLSGPVRLTVLNDAVAAPDGPDDADGDSDAGSSDGGEGGSGGGAGTAANAAAGAASALPGTGDATAGAFPAASLAVAMAAFALVAGLLARRDAQARAAAGAHVRR